MTPLENGAQSRQVRALQILFCSILLILALQVPGYAEERRSLTVSPGAGPVGTKVTVRGTGWDPEYYSAAYKLALSKVWQWRSHSIRRRDRGSARPGR